MVWAINEELKIKKNTISEVVDTIYLGGGTPSILSNQELESIFNTIYKNYIVSNNPEITLEANPDDLTVGKINFLKNNTPVNRFSIGIQSFFDDDLQFMNRAHTADEAIQSIQHVKKAGFENITIDLIYGVPNSKNWKKNLQLFFELDIPHLSSYALTIEEKTVLHHLIKNKKVTPVNDEQQEKEYNQLIDAIQKNGFEQYEISNFAKNQHYSRHNSNYWKSEVYLGVGPSAHSFDGKSRYWNKPNNTHYITSLKKGEIPFEQEVLTLNDQYNERVMIGLRTKWGIDLKGIRNLGNEYEAKLLDLSKQHREEGKIKIQNNTLLLNPKYRFWADGIASDLFIVE